MNSSKQSQNSMFPSIRLIIALALSLCYMALSISTSNIAVSMVCMVKEQGEKSSNLENAQNLIANKSVENIPFANKMEGCNLDGKLNWNSDEQGFVLAAQNVGSLLMLFTGTKMDRMNSKWAIMLALLFLVLSNILFPFVVHSSICLAILARFFVGFADALLQPSSSSLVSRWFPPEERPFALGLITGGRQIGTLLILPLASVLCTNSQTLGGWPVIFHLSTFVCISVFVLWIFIGADKPSKHCCISANECNYIESNILHERIGKRTECRQIDWRELAKCKPLYASIGALICHEYPLVIMIQMLPKYLNEVLHVPLLFNGTISALPIAVLFLSKTFASYFCSLLLTISNKSNQNLSRSTRFVKWFNGIGSMGLGLCTAAVPFFNNSQESAAILTLCLATAFAGLHTPGVQTALVQIAPAYNGMISGIAFSAVAIFSIFNKLLSNYIIQHGSPQEWMIVFLIAGTIALLPVFFFSIWGSAELQSWAAKFNRRPSICPTISSISLSIQSENISSSSAGLEKDLSQKMESEEKTNNICKQIAHIVLNTDSFSQI